MLGEDVVCGPELFVGSGGADFEDVAGDGVELVGGATGVEQLVGLVDGRMIGGEDGEVFGVVAAQFGDNLVVETAFRIWIGKVEKIEFFQ